MTDVVFRKDRGEVVAIFPYLPFSTGFLSCYSHVGQHSGCSYEWYKKTKPATPEEYGPLLGELRQMYPDIQAKKQISYKAWLYTTRRK